MLARIANVAGGASRLVELKARQGLAEVRRIGVTTIGYAAAALLATFALCGFLGAGYLVLAPQLGPAAALAVISGVGLGAAALIWLAAYLNRRSSPGDLRREIDQEQRRLRSALGIGGKNATMKTEAKSRPDDDGPHNTASMDPKLLAAAGFAVVTLLGPRRLFRLLRFAAAIMSASTVAKRAAHDTHHTRGESDDRSSQTHRRRHGKRTLSHNGAAARPKGFAPKE